MPYLIAAVVLVGALGLLNLVLSFGIIRRLREQAAIGHHDPAPDAGEKPWMALQQQQVRPFAVETADGVRIDRDALPDRLLVAFLSATCDACAQRLPRFREVAGRLPRSQVLAIAVGPLEETVALRTELAEFAQVAAEEDLGPVAAAFSVEGYPAFLMLDSAGVVLASGWDAGVFDKTPGLFPHDVAI